MAREIRIVVTPLHSTLHHMTCKLIVNIHGILKFMTGVQTIFVEICVKYLSPEDIFCGRFNPKCVCMKQLILVALTPSIFCENPDT